MWVRDRQASLLLQEVVQKYMIYWSKKKNSQSFNDWTLDIRPNLWVFGSWSTFFDFLARNDRALQNDFWVTTPPTAAIANPRDESILKYWKMRGLKLEKTLLKSASFLYVRKCYTKGLFWWGTTLCEASSLFSSAFSSRLNLYNKPIKLLHTLNWWAHHTNM